MREILFRAKRKDNGEWVEGYYSQLPKISLGATIITNGDLCAEDVSDYIIVNKCKQHSNFSNGHPLAVIEGEYYEIDPDTLCPYIGQNDKNDQKIHEGDICIIRTASIDEDDGYFIVRFDMNTLRFVLIGDDLQVDFGMISGSDCEVVGNVFETLELVADKE